MPVKKIEKLTLLLLIITFAFGYSLVSVLRHIRFESFGYDLGIYDQAIWLFSRFESPFSTIKNSHIFGDHFIPAVFLLSPLYWIWNDPKILLLFQAVWLAGGAVPIYFLAKEKLKNIFLSFTLVFLFLSFFGVQNAIVFDFHPITVAVPLISWWFYFLEKRKTRSLLLLSFLILGLQENISLLMITLGLVALRKKRVLGVAIIILSTCWFLLATKIFMPHFFYLPTRPFLAPLALLKELFYPLEKTKTILVSLGSFAFLPIFSPLFLIPIFEQFIERFVGNIVATRWGIGLHYSALLAPILAFASIETLKKDFFKKRKRLSFLIGFFLVFIAFSYQVFFHLPLNLLLKKDFYKLPEEKIQIEKAMRTLSEESSVAAQNNLVPHLSHRKKIFVFSSCEDVPDPSEGMSCHEGFSLIEKEKVEFILVDFHRGQNPNNFFPDGEERLKKYVEKLLLDKKYKIKMKEGETILLERI